MDTFRDEVYEEMDDISKLIEPFEFKANNEIAQFPDEFEVSATALNSVISAAWHEDYMSISLGSLVRDKASELQLNNLLIELSDNKLVHRLFEFKIVTDGDLGLAFDATTGVISNGSIHVVKKGVAMEDSDIEQKMVQHVQNYLYNHFIYNKCNKKNLNQIAELFGATEARKARKWTEKIIALSNHFKELILSRQLVIKDFELFKRFVNWNKVYIEHGNLPAFANIARLKVMMRSGKPIYSMKEDDV